MKAFKSPRKFLAELDADAIASMVTAAADVTLIVDQAGMIRDYAFNNDDLARDLDGAGRWRGRAWAETVTPDSRSKVETILRDAAAGVAPRWRHVNYPVSPGEPPAPVHYCAVQVDDLGRTVAFGRDLRAVSALQQQLIDAQQAMERDYSRLRHIETRYRLLFQMSSEAVLIVDVGTLRIMESNPAADRLLGESGGRLVGRPLAEAFERQGWRAVQGLLAGVKANGRPDWVRVEMSGQHAPVTVAASLFRQDDSAMFLVRLSPGPGAEVAGEPSFALPVAKVMEHAPDGFVVTDADGHVLTANEAFLEMAQLASQEQARGQSLERWLGRSGVDLSILVANLKQRGMVRLFATTLRNELGTSADVEISAVSVSLDDKAYLGFLVRGVGRRLKPETAPIGEVPRSLEQLNELVGRVSLKQLVRETTDLIEKMSIEAALRLTDDNRASAAEILGLSRQSLYVKLRRFGLADGPPQPGDPDR
ncbi:MAG: transcriptional regulator PpsR [Proteobacteria bacterium]|nr:transcriptional regulator PpsR [Pseudomonadota bacterium]